MVRFGPDPVPRDSRPIVLAALPLFEEANRTRHFLVTILRALAGRGIASVLPDFPGTGESLVNTGDARLSDQRDAYAALVLRLGHPVFAVSLRSGALLDAGATVAGRWHLAPQSGADLLRDLNRTRALAPDGGADYAGNRLSPAMLAELRDAEPRAPGDPLRIVRLDTDPRPADATYPGSPLWRRAEPGTDGALAARLTDDIAAWIATCAA